MFGQRSLGTVCYYNIHCFHTAPKYWDRPLEFDPTRFLSPDGTKIVQHEHFLPFGFGKRKCMGESFAKAELFLFAVLLIEV